MRATYAGAERTAVASPPPSESAVEERLHPRRGRPQVPVPRRAHGQGLPDEVTKVPRGGGPGGPVEVDDHDAVSVQMDVLGLEVPVGHHPGAAGPGQSLQSPLCELTQSFGVLRQQPGQRCSVFCELPSFEIRRQVGHLHAPDTVQAGEPATGPPGRGCGGPRVTVQQRVQRGGRRLLLREELPGWGRSRTARGPVARDRRSRHCAGCPATATPARRRLRGSPCRSPASGDEGPVPESRVTVHRTTGRLREACTTERVSTCARLCGRASRGGGEMSSDWAIASRSARGAPADVAATAPAPALTPVTSPGRGQSGRRAGPAPPAPPAPPCRRRCRPRR